MTRDRLTPEQRAQFDGWPADVQARFLVHAQRSEWYRRDPARDVTVGLGGPGSPAHYWANGMAGLAEDYVSDLLGMPRNGQRGPDGGVDLRWNGLRLDVKWRRSHAFDLMAPAHLSGGLRSDLYILVTGADPMDFRLCGYAPKARLLAASTDDFGHGPTLVVGQRDLLPADNLTTGLAAWW